jgi:glutaminyl-peptide cyclotransferase
VRRFALLPLLAPLALVGAAPPPIPVAKPTIVASYPHDTAAFTEGLLIDRGRLYESTGREGQSYIREVDLKTGRKLREVAVPPGQFGEGIVAWKNELRSVTWHGGQGYRWTLPALKRTGGFTYTGEGWAMTDDGRRIYLSDGTPTLRLLDPATMKVTGTLSVTIAGKPLPRINELEYVNGELLANIWMTPAIARIDPATGVVKGLIDLSDLVAQVAATDPDSVANGIAYDRTGHHLYVTGKNWPKLFEIRLEPAGG